MRSDVSLSCYVGRFYVGHDADTVSERVKLQFHLEAFSVPNHPGTSVPTPGSDGVITLHSSYDSARQLQLALRLARKCELEIDQVTTRRIGRAARRPLFNNADGIYTS